VTGVHTGEPVPHWMEALATQGSVEVQEAPWSQATQAPPLQTWPVPQNVPFGAGPVGTHTGTPVEHEKVPVLQGLPGGVQLPPAAQLTHCPVPEQTWSVPQGVPAAAKAVGVHTGEPVPQAMAAAVTQAFGGVQVASCTQPPQIPAAEQTCPVPQEAPAARKVRSVQTGAPLEHS
jgi:hypothetical protein